MAGGLRGGLSASNRVDKEIARRLGAQLNLVGADIWFDEWEIHASDSIPGWLNDALPGLALVEGSEDQVGKRSVSSST